jgi:predicted transcriptional regulator
MNSTSTFTIRVSTDIKHRLDKLAKSIKRTRSWLAADAVENYLAEQEHHLALIEQAEREIEAGRAVPHEDVARWLLSWGTDHELPPPSCK